MLVSAALVLVVFLGVMGLVLDNAYRESARESLSERLLLHIYALIAASVEDNVNGQQSLYLPEQLQEPHFNTMGSGLFGIVFDESGNEIWRSLSALDLELDATVQSQLLTPGEPGVVVFEQTPRLANQASRFYLVYPVVWQGASRDARFTYVVLQDDEAYRKEIAAFRNNLWGWLVAGVLVLVGLQAAIMSWGLKPIGDLAVDLKAIEGGERDYLEGRYPSEIAGVTQNLNLLLSAEREQREKYRTTLADLAHSLKTPLAILQGEAEKSAPEMASIQSSMLEQVNRMNEIVSYQLERAVSVSSTLVRESTAVAPVLNKLVSAIRKVYVDKHISLDTDIEPCEFPGDERDLMELVGNLLDNACKYGDGQVRLFAGIRDDAVMIQVDDNGAGILPAARAQVLQRGIRLDTREAGQGIGLAVVAEIVSRYSGSILISDSPLGGARVTVTFT